VGKPKGLKQGAVTARVKARTTAPKPAVGKVKTGKKAKIDDSKVYRVTSRLNNVVRNSDQKTGVKRLNAIQVGARAKSFLARKEGGSVGMLNQKSQPEAYASVRKAMTKPPRYSTQKPNRNKPGRFNDLGQDKARVKSRAAAVKPARVSPKTNGRVAELTKFRDSQRKQLKEINQKIKDAGPLAGGLRLEKLKIRDRLNQLNSDLVRAGATTAVRRTKK
jgi:hypothetical protein